MERQVDFSLLFGKNKLFQKDVYKVILVTKSTTRSMRPAVSQQRTLSLTSTVESEVEPEVEPEVESEAEPEIEPEIKPEVESEIEPEV